MVLIILAALGLAVLAVRLASSSARTSYATPSDCLDAYRDACLAGDAATYLNCLGEPLRSQAAQRFTDLSALADYLQRNMKDAKSWVELGSPEVAGSTAVVDVEEVRTAGSLRTRFHFQRLGRGWLIVQIEQPQEVPTSIPFGTHVSQVP
jgi:hypothetical protein